MKNFLATLWLLVLGAGAMHAQEPNDATRRLRIQNAQFTDQMIKVADSIYVAVSFSVSNVSMIVGAEEVVIVDTGMMLDDAVECVNDSETTSLIC